MLPSGSVRFAIRTSVISMNGWLSPEPPPATPAQWEALREAVDDALRLQPRVGRNLIRLLTIQPILSSIISLIAILKKRSGAARWRICERDDNGFFRPNHQNLSAVFQCLYAVGGRGCIRSGSQECRADA